MIDINTCIDGFDCIKIPRLADKNYSINELGDMLADLMTKFTAFNNGPKAIPKKDKVDMKVPQYLFYLLSEKYLSNLPKSDQDKVWTLAGIHQNNSHRSQASALPGLIRSFTNSVTPIYSNKLLQRIYYGAPGTGKSHKAKKDTVGYKVYRTTFHPDADYASFVGSYKPIVNENGIVRDSSGHKVKDENDKIIEYKYVPQIFINAYIDAWRSLLNDELPQPVCIIIEELNRGNCAQIFGDLFQLLDRNSSYYSEYSIIAQEELAAHLRKELGNNIERYYNMIRNNSDLDGTKLNIPIWDKINPSKNDIRLSLPPNLSIVCTMNTSDQSLFPMDSAFKRRWQWEYVPIIYEKTICPDSDFTIKIDNTNQYSWLEFLEVINKKIYDITKSEDKQMGNFFVNGDGSKVVDKEQFVYKVMYYLWSEVCKDSPSAKKTLFIYEKSDGFTSEFSFTELFPMKDNADILNGFMKHHIKK